MEEWNTVKKKKKKKARRQKNVLRKKRKADKQGERDWGWCQVQKIEAVVADNQMIQHLGVFLSRG